MAFLAPSEKLLLALLLLSPGLVVQIDSVSVINNITLPSDIIQDRFLAEVRSGLNVVELVGVDIVSSLKCISDLKQIVNQFPNRKAAKFIDSWGKIPSGILYGNLVDIGNYDECVDASLPVVDSDNAINGQFCFASIPLSSGLTMTQEEINLLRASPVEQKSLLSLVKLTLGICLPDTCDSKLISQVLGRIIANIFNSSNMNISVSSCSVAKKPNFSPLDIFAIVLFSIFGLFLLLSSLYDWYTRYCDIKPKNLLIAFSIITNAKKIFLINTKKSPNSIDCIHGIRVLSMVWILQCHTYALFSALKLINYVDIPTWLKSASSMIILMGNVSVDTFFLISGILIAWVALQELDKTKGRLNVIMMWVHRYIRLTPPIAALILFNLTLDKYVGRGPFKKLYTSMNGPCETNWWQTLLYVQNYASDEGSCITQAWYLAIDTQLYFFSPLILIPLWKWGKKFIPVMVVLCLSSMGYVVAIYFVKGYKSIVGFYEIDWMTSVYIPTHTRFPVWLVGVGLGYFMHINKGKSIRPPKLFQMVGWMMSIGVMICIIFAPFNAHDSWYRGSVGEAAAYESLKRVSWAIALSWIVYACYFGFGGIINSFLSHPSWQPLSRLTYSFYLVHYGIQTINYGIVKTNVYFSNYVLLLNFWSTFGMSFLVAVAWSLSFEAPVLVIEKVLLSMGKKTSKETTIPVIPASAPPIDNVLKT